MYLMILFQIIGDLFRDKALGGLAKALWMLVLVIAPFLGALVYLIARGRGMSERAGEALREHQAAADHYIRTVAGTSPAQEIATAQELLTAGAITPDEFARLKAQALAGR
ncbi:MAG: PLDc_N domain-containing protein [Cellulomonas sp.]|nr:PLDc_N domain-containing protein [Cellulomonas sp.]